MKKINIGLIGFGKIGSGVVRALKAKRKFLKEKKLLEELNEQRLAVKTKIDQIDDNGKSYIEVEEEEGDDDDKEDEENIYSY